MIPEYVVVQAGGRGSRLGYLTDNKPECTNDFSSISKIPG